MSQSYFRWAAEASRGERAEPNAIYAIYLMIQGPAGRKACEGKLDTVRRVEELGVCNGEEEYPDKASVR